MKKMLILSLCMCILCGALGFPTYAQQSRSYAWYCKHVKDHAQPPIESSLSFIEELGGYYLDRHATDDDKVIYLTFDAGYENGNIERILDVLKEEQVSAAFFVLSHLVKNDTALVARMVSDGHLVCNHTASHKDMSRMNSTAFLTELRTMEQIYEEATGNKMERYYRPPEGKFSRENLTSAQENGYKTIFWSFAYPDWDNNRQMTPEKAKSIVLENAHNGEIMLLHPTSTTNADILKDVITELKSQGYRFGTLHELTEKGE